VAADHGFVAPDWYATLQVHAEAIGGADALGGALEAAGFASWSVTEEAVDVGLDLAEDVVRYRLAVPQLREWVVTLPDARRTALVAEAADAVRRTGERFAPVVVEAVARP
jgi:hypothetical protein